MSSGSAFWYLTRGSGVVALLLLTATTVIGVLTAGGWRSEQWPRFAIAAVHRNVTLVALAFIGIHVGTTIADGYTPIAVKDVFVPFVSQYRPIWLGLGALTLDLLLAIAISSAFRKHIGYRAWRLLHWTAYATWPLALAHGLGTGSDARRGWMSLLALACLALVALAVAGRLLQSRTPALQVLAGGATLCTRDRARGLVRRRSRQDGVGSPRRNARLPPEDDRDTRPPACIRTRVDDVLRAARGAHVLVRTGRIRRRGGRDGDGDTRWRARGRPADALGLGAR